MAWNDKRRASWLAGRPGGRGTLGLALALSRTLTPMLTLEWAAWHVVLCWAVWAWPWLWVIMPRSLALTHLLTNSVTNPVIHFTDLLT